MGQYFTRQFCKKVQNAAEEYKWKIAKNVD